MKRMEELKDMLCEELDDITAKGQISAGDLDAIDKLTHSIKSIETIIAMHGYSNDMDGGSYRRDSMGRYSRGYSRGGRDGYSYDVKSELRELMNDAHDEREREAIRMALERM